MKVLITHPDFQDPGGVANYYRQLRGKFDVPVKHFIIGKRPDERGLPSRFLRMFRDYCAFVQRIRKADVDLVHLNPSLDLKSFAREGVFSLTARICGKKTVVFFRGWKKSFEACVDSNLVWMFKLLFGQSDAFVVLCDEFRVTLKKWGVVKPIYQEVTIIDDDTLEGFDIHKTLQDRHESSKWRILFLSRILRAKGIYETVQAVSLLQTRYPNVELVVAGEGDKLDDVRSFAHDVGASNVIFPGYVQGKEKRRLFEEANIFCLPSYSEGLPGAVIEAMAFGLPVVTRPVGGLVDLFQDGEHGLISDSLDPEVIAGMIEKLFLDKEVYDRISLSNHQYAQRHFLASSAASRLETLYSTVLSAN